MAAAPVLVHHAHRRMLHAGKCLVHLEEECSLGNRGGKNRREREELHVQGNIADWKKKEGEEFAAGDVLAEIETDKVRDHPLSSGHTPHIHEEKGTRMTIHTALYMGDRITLARAHTASVR
jgi:hypothetical protein